MNSLIRFAALASLSYTLADLLNTGEITYYINPRFLPLTKFSLAFLVVLAFITIIQYLIQRRDSVTRYTVRGASILVLLACLTPFVFPPKMMDSSMAEQKGMLSLQSSTPQQSDSTQNVEPQQIQINQEDRDLIKEFTNSEGVITITSINYLDIFINILDHQDKYLNKEIEVEGVVMHHESLGPNQYLVARYAIACCAADASIIGFVVEGSTALADNSWVKIRGKILRLDSNNQPIVEVNKIDKILPLAEPYIYQYY